MLVNPNTSKGRKAIQKWSDPERPDRHIVCYTFVTASLAYGDLMTLEDMRKALPIFIHDELPLNVYLHRGLGHHRKQVLLKALTLAGAVIVDRSTLAKVIIADPTQPSYENLVARYAHNNDIHVETPEWVWACIERKTYDHDPAVARVVGGRKPNTNRVEFTEEDDQHLAEYIGMRLPRPDMPGRTGNNLYRELCDREDIYPWATRHSWQSWRNRYKTRRIQIDALVTQFLAAHPQPTNGKGQYNIARTQSEVNPKKKRKAGDNDEGTAPAPVRRRTSEAKGVRRPPKSGRRASEAEVLRSASSGLEEDAETMMRKMLSQPDAANDEI
ncbi:hypothetical protein FRB99_007559 [Tulasnella sp. 403]|nr:hypothetical protein FRB99_007559 [Tulasnella sp. 403]